MASAQASECGQTSKKKQSAVVVPELFHAAGTPDDFVLLVEGTELHVSKGALASQSGPLSAMVFNEGFRDAQEGKVDLKGKKLTEIVPLLCWVYREEDPLAKNKTFGNAGRFKGIAMEDMAALLVLADEYQINRLQSECRLVYQDFFDNGLKSKAALVMALEPLEALGMKEEELRATLDKLLNAGLSVTDVTVLVASTEFSLRLHKFLVARLCRQMETGKLCIYCDKGIGSCGEKNHASRAKLSLVQPETATPKQLIPDIFSQAPKNLSFSGVKKISVCNDFLYAKRGALAAQSNKLSKKSLLFHTYGLSASVGFLCWLYREDDPSADQKTYADVGKHFGIATEDIVGLIRIANDFKVPRLGRDSVRVYCYIMADLKTTGEAKKALPALELVVNAIKEELKEEWLVEFFSRLTAAGISMDDVESASFTHPFLLQLYQKEAARLAKRMEKAKLCFRCGGYGYNNYRFNSYFQEPCSCRPVE